MLTAVASDFATIADCKVDVLHDVRLDRPSLSCVTFHDVTSASVEQEVVQQLAAQADWTLVIAPEFDGHLLRRVCLVESAGGRLLSPNARLVTLASDKQATAEYLGDRGVPVPNGIALNLGAVLPTDFPYPGVLKPRDGAGSLGVRYFDACDRSSVLNEPSRLEVYCPGAAASVGCLAGAGRIIPLEPCLQRLGGEYKFDYYGGSLPIDSQRAARARLLAVAAIAAFPDPCGYLGVDLVLGPEASGRQDFVIEVNPRLTTSYVGLRRLSRVNLAAAMIAVAEGRDAELCWNVSRVRFTSAGYCEVLPVGESVL